MKEKKQRKEEKHKCNCQKEATLFPGMAGYYDPAKELPYVNHTPGNCRCTNQLKQYILHGKKTWLCSNCVGQGERGI